MFRVGKATADLELNLTKDVKGFHEYMNSKRKTRENMNSLLNRAGKLVRKDTKTAKVLNVLFTGVTGCRNPRHLRSEKRFGTRRGGGGEGQDEEQD